MKSKAGLKIINQLTEGRFLFFALSSLAPALIAIIFAVVMAFKYDHLLLFSALIGTPVPASLPFTTEAFIRKRKNSKCRNGFDQRSAQSFLVCA